MTDTLAIFSEQVITVAREVGVDGKLGAQAKVPGAAGTWRDLTDNVNQLAANLTTQVRAIGDVATAVTTGDLTRYVTVEASGEVAALKDNINEMIRNLKETTQKTREQDWLKTNLARFTRMLQGQRDLSTVAEQVLSELAALVAVQHGAFYLTEADENRETHLTLLASYAAAERVTTRFRLGEGLVGQCAVEARRIQLVDVPADYISVRSGLGSSAPRSLSIVPVLFEGQVNAVIELASFESMSDIHQVFLDQLTESIGIVVNTIAASTRTETLLAQSQSLTQELQLQQEELRTSNERLESQAATLRESEERLKQQQDELRTTNEQLEEKAKLLEVKNREVEYAKAEIEDKAEQIALTSRYKSEFLANMSHELRTPLNSLLILSRMLTENTDGNLTPKQVEFARTIHGSGTDLLGLINDILELAKIESGTIAVEPEELLLDDLRDYVEQNFRHVADQKGLDFEVHLMDGLPRTIVTDSKRLQQVLKNLLSNAFKFTSCGGVTLQIKHARFGWSADQTPLNEADQVIAFSVTDTGIGIPEDKQRIIFEAFQQADGTTSRRFGGTGLGLSISREIAGLLGGELMVASIPGTGSTFTLFLARSRSASDIAHLGTPRSSRPESPERTGSNSLRIADDLAALAPGDSALVISDTDLARTQLLVEGGRAHGLKVVISNHASPLALARQHAQCSLALELAGDTWILLHRLKRDTTLRGVPVLGCGDVSHRVRALRAGVVAYIPSPATPEAVGRALARLREHAARTVQHALVIAPDSALQELVELVAGETVHCTAIPADPARLPLSSPQGRFDCVIIDVRDEAPAQLETMAVLVDWSRSVEVPIVVLERDGAAAGPYAEVLGATDHCVLKRTRSLPGMLDQVNVYLHRSISQLTDVQQQAQAKHLASLRLLQGRKVLVIDDDVRNIFAITSALESHGADVHYAETGQDGLTQLERTRDIAAVLVDIMMPEMDGYEVIRRIREQACFEQLPIIAVTAQAMRTDREKCLAAGATDYLAKPIEVEDLLVLLGMRLSL